MHQAGPAIFPIDEAKDHCHGINSVVDASTLQALCFTGISSRAKLMSLSRNLASWPHIIDRGKPMTVPAQ
jgi:hypothetical protein